MTEPPAVTNAFHHRLAKLSESATISDADFADCCYQAVAHHGMDPDDLRRALDLGGHPVDRWIQGANLPQPAVRGKILRAVLRILKNG